MTFAWLVWSSLVFLSLWRTKYRDFVLRHSDEVFFPYQRIFPKATAVAVKNQNLALVTAGVTFDFP